jgi:beta-xylosidase
MRNHRFQTWKITTRLGMHSFACILLLGACQLSARANEKPWGSWQKWGAQPDGTYFNPVLPADYSDLDCIQVGADYYAISSTMQFSPGMVVLKSSDMVNWTIAGHAVSDLTQISPELNWDRMNRGGRGVWAGGIRYHNNKFWVYLSTPDEGYFVTTATNPAGPWEPLRPLLKERGWDDCCPFWDDDGQGYLVGTHFADNCKTYLWKLTPDGYGLVQDSKTQINEGAHREANKLYKFNGWYYHLFSEVNNGTRVVMIQRSKNILGPYMERRQLTDSNRAEHEPNQGGFLKNDKDAWYFLTHHGNGDWAGRLDSLLPVTWVDGWPIIGKTDANGAPGKMVWSGQMPFSTRQRFSPQGTDEFSQGAISPQWEWNYQPRAEMFSLKERPGWLRLKAFRPLRPNTLVKAGNTISQRSFQTASNTVVVKVDLQGMADGQRAGLCHFATSSSAIGVYQEGNRRTLEFRLNDKVEAGPELKNGNLWLKSTWGLDGKNQFFYSTDGISFIPFGTTYQLAWGNYRGDRIGIYSFNDKNDAGYLDVDFLHYTY